MAKKKEYNEMENLILRTMQNRKKDNKKWEWSFVLRDLQKNTHEGQIVKIKDIPVIVDDTWRESEAEIANWICETYDKKVIFIATDPHGSQPTVNGVREQSRVLL